MSAILEILGFVVIMMTAYFAFAFAVTALASSGPQQANVLSSQQDEEDAIDGESLDWDWNSQSGLDHSPSNQSLNDDDMEITCYEPSLDYESDPAFAFMPGNIFHHVE